MRQLRLTSPRIAGPDVRDWQTLLSQQGFIESADVDGIFGPNTSRATKAYQQQAGLDADGIVGAGTLARAVLDGFGSTQRPFLSGFDASANCTAFVDGLAGMGMKFAIRYYSSAASKAMSPQEARVI